MSTPDDRPAALPADRTFARLQTVLPTRLLSWLMFRLTRLQHPGFVRGFIRLFLKLFPSIDLSEAQPSRVEAFGSFNAFFTRALRPGARPLAAGTGWVCPVDGTVSQCGRIEQGRLFQAKGHHYSAAELLGDEALARPFQDGSFCTIYLAPYNYHRIHLPQRGQLREWLYVPGRLFSVNAATARAMPRLFARNERVVSLWETPEGPLALVMVGALFVGSMETVWAGLISPPHRRGRNVERYQPIHPVSLGRGDEMGRFNMGSTVILLAAPGALRFLPHLLPGRVVRMGEALASP